MKIQMPYGDEYLTADVQDGRIKAILGSAVSSNSIVNKTEREIVSDALAHPIDALPLCEMVKQKRHVTIITSDHTRPMPSHITMPLLLSEIRKGSPDAEIIILVATGLHRATTPAELETRFGTEIYKNEKIIVHDCKDKNAIRQVGVLPSGGNLLLSKYALDADLLVAEGFIEPHFFAGFSGGRKSVLPGVAGYESVIANHCSSFIADQNASSGVMDANPVNIDMEYAANIAGLAFILNVILDDKRVIVDAFAGNPVTAHLEGTKNLLKKAAVNKTVAPIVITSNGGYPLDQNLYQLVKCMDTAEKCCEEGGVIIAVGECRDGSGGESFYQDFAGGDSPRSLLERILSRSQSETKADQWQSQILARILGKRHIIIVAPLIENIVKSMGLGFARTLEEALSIADTLMPESINESSKIIVIPNGLGIVITQ